MTAVNTAKLINHGLYRRLCRRYGDSNVTVVRPGVPIDWQMIKRQGANGSFKTRRVRESGEEYRVNCPFCGDTRQRLLINHMFGAQDHEIENKQHMWLAQCLNETRCLDDHTNQRELYARLYSTFGGYKPAIRQVTRQEVEEHVGPVEHPGKVVSLRKLAERKADHPAVAYLRSRNYDPSALSDLYGIGFVYDCSDRYVNNRIYIPVMEQGELRGWQARYVGDDINGQTFSKTRIPKYYTMPGYRKTDHLYNFEKAIRCPTVVLVEGAIDVWGFGHQAVGTFGCKLSYTQAELIVREWRKRHRKRARVVILYDPTPENVKPMRDGRKPPHQIERARQRLSELMDASQILPVYLPGGDPGSLDPRLQRRIIRRAAADAGITDLVLLKPDPVRLV